ncbi:MAG: hypothetical protein QOJ70_2680 [Acidobacteriota bacterium]|jgi:CHAT domain-containing protein/tetratricopeptide (TPR) repeat protein|nr:hypothetical protein [Acidobacteriota bacterium]
MNQDQFWAAVRSLFDARTEEAFDEIVSRHPELLDEETANAINYQVLKARERGDANMARALEEIEMSLESAARRFDLKASGLLDIEPITPEASVPWARLTREYLARRELQLLDAAISEAQESRETDAVALLRYFRNQHQEQVEALSVNLLNAFYSAARNEEALTVMIISLDFSAGMARHFRRYPFDQQMEALNIGLHACRQVDVYARALGDAACRAYYLVGQALGYAEARYLNEAAEAYEEALELYRALAKQQPQAYTPHVAVTLNNLGNVQARLRMLDEADVTLEEALARSRALAEQQPEVYTPDVAETLSNVGAVRAQLRKFGEAEAAYEESLKISRALAERQPEAYAPHLARTLMNLGNVLIGLQKLHEADAVYEEALTKYRILAEKQPGVYMPELAGTLSNLGNVRRELRKLNEAEAALKEALTINRSLAERQPEVYVPDLVGMLGNLGRVQSNLRKPIEAQATFEEALAVSRSLAQEQPEVYTPDVASSLINLGSELLMLSELTQARAALEEALIITRERDLLIERGKALSLLAELAIMANDWNEGTQLLQEAIAQIERLRTVEHNLSRRGQVLSEHVTVYEQLLVCLLKQGEKEKALVVAEQGKSRSINDLLAAREFRPKDEQLAQERDELLVKVRSLEDRESFAVMQPQNTNLTDEQEKALRQQLASLRSERVRATEELEKLGRKIQQAEPDFLPYAPTLSFDEIKQVAQSAVATLLLFRVTDYGSFVFLVFPDGERDVVEVPAFDVNTLSEMLVKFENGEPVSGWSGLYYRGQTGAWMELMEATLHRLYNELIEPVHQRLREKRRHMNGSKRLVIVPNRGLAILPLHACSWKEEGEIKYLLDEYVCAYAPSIYILKRSQSRKRGLAEPDSLLGLFNPNRDDPARRLAFSEWECDEIEGLLGGDRCSMKKGGLATKESVLSEVSRHQLLHFSCHGNYELDAPLQSSLTLADATLNLDEIMARMDLRHTWLTVLSACETSLGDFREIADEQYGLPLGFMVAGTPTVWGTLWSVSDQSTALLMIKAYQVLTVEPDMSKPEALRLAQLWLRDVSREELLLRIEERLEALETGNQEWGGLISFRRYVKRFGQGERPFAHPYYWAGMQCVGV